MIARSQSIDSVKRDGSESSEKLRTHDITKPLSTEHMLTHPLESEDAAPLNHIREANIQLFTQGPSCLRQHPDYKNVKWVIFPDDTAKGVWDLLIFAYVPGSVLLFCAGVEPFRLAFPSDEGKESHWMVTDWIVMGTFILDLFVNFLTCYYDESLTLVTSRRKIASRYVKTWFALDALSCIPLDEFIGISKVSTSYGKLVRLPRLYRLLKSGK